MERSMEAIVACCAGLDVHQAGVVACLNRGGKEIRSFGTTRGELAEMCAWLRAGGCTLVAMESTGVYWHPVYFALEGQFELIVGNAQHIKNVPGRKTDVKDCDWISDLARHGLIAKSFVPPKPIRELRELTRYRRKLVQVQAAERNRLIKLLESADIKLAGLIADVFDVSGRAILHALIEGEETPDEMAQHSGIPSFRTKRGIERKASAFRLRILKRTAAPALMLGSCVLSCTTVRCGDPAKSALQASLRSCGAYHDRHQPILVR